MLPLFLLALTVYVTGAYFTCCKALDALDKRERAWVSQVQRDDYLLTYNYYIKNTFVWPVIFYHAVIKCVQEYKNLDEEVQKIKQRSSE